jgi:hypothetical protein
LSLDPVMAKLPVTARMLAIITASGSGKDDSNSMDISQAWSLTKKRNLQRLKAGTIAIAGMSA